MIQLRTLLSAFLFASAAHAETHASLATIEIEVAALTKEVRSAEVPDLLIASLRASNENIRSSFSYLALRKAEIPLMRKWKSSLADKIAVELALRKTAMSSDEIAAGFALHTHYGRGCTGWRAAAKGLFGANPDTADDMVLITLGVMTIAPSWYIEGHERRTARVAKTIEDMAQSKAIAPERALKLLGKSVPNPMFGPGC